MVYGAHKILIVKHFCRLSTQMSSIAQRRVYFDLTRENYIGFTKLLSSMSTDIHVYLWTWSSEA